MNDAEHTASELDKRRLLQWVGDLCRRRNVDTMSVLGRNRFKAITSVRDEIWALLCWTLGMNYCELGRIWQRDHTTISYGVRRYEERMLKDLAVYAGVR